MVDILLNRRAEVLKSIWHFCFTVSNLTRSLAFYRDILGFSVVHTQRQANLYTQKLVGYPEADLKVALLRLPGNPVPPSGHQLELIEYVAPVGKRIQLDTPNPGVSHLAFEVEDIHQLYKRFSELGVRFKSEPVAIDYGRNKGGFSVYFLDPDGITLEMVQPPHYK
jgi:lactoylglutathione lyase